MEFKIEGFENMTAEEKLAAIAAYDPTQNGYVAKETLDKATSEAAGYKKQLKDLQNASQNAANNQKSLEDRIAELEKEKAISGAEAKYLGLGYSAELAKSSAQALISGDYDKLFADLQSFNADMAKKTAAERIKQTPGPLGGTASQSPDYSKLIAEAQARNDYSAVAYYTRLSQQNKSE